MITFLFLWVITFLLVIDKLFFAWLIPIFILSILYLFIGDIYTFSLYYGFVGVDYFRIFIIFITLWVFYYCVLCFKDFKSFFYIWGMFLFLVLCFIVDNFLLFYIFFEVVFLLIFVFLLRWGKTIERIQASFYIFFYTLVFSLPFFVFIIYCLSNFLNIRFFSMNFFCGEYNWLVFFIIIVFIVKLPLYGVHLWLPKAHVEAPVTGSILLAGVLLKLGAYGLFRFFPFIEEFSSSRIFWNVFFYFSIIGGVIISMICVRQRDLKIIIAYSSIVHIRFIVIGLISFSDIGLIGAILMLVAHGFISPFLFFGLNYIYEIFHSRSVFVLKGVGLFIPIFGLFWFLGVVFNTGFPPFMSFFSEVIISIGFGFLGALDWVVLLIFFFMCGLYNIYLYVFPTHGGVSFFLSSYFSYDYLFLGFIHFWFILIFPLMCLWLISLIKILVCGTKEKISLGNFLFFLNFSFYRVVIFCYREVFIFLQLFSFKLFSTKFYYRRF